MPKFVVALLTLLLLALPARAQTALGGVAITSEGLLQMRATGAVPVRQAGQPGLTYISLARVVEQLKAAAEKKAPVAKSLRTFQGLTRFEYVFVYPAEHDLVIAGSSEALRAENPLQPVGVITGRPALQLDDLIVALRAVNANPAGNRGGRGRAENTIYGCSLDLTPNAEQIAREVGKRFAGFPSSRIAAELKNALGPQQVRVLGVPADSRMALAMVAADYRLKRIAMGAEQLANVGNALSSGLSSSRVWFEPAYDAVVVAQDGLSYQFTGPRLKVLAGAQDFDAQGATVAATAFARRFSDRMKESAARVEAIADLQNITDLFLLATLIRFDGLAQKSGLDVAWLLDAANYKTAVTPVPQYAETIVNDSGPTIVEGGVMLASEAFRNLPRGKEGKTELASVRQRPSVEWFLTKTP